MMENGALASASGTREVKESVKENFMAKRVESGVVIWSGMDGELVNCTG